MMEWNDIGIKEAEDVIECLRAGAKAFDLHRAHGERIAGLLADACDMLMEESVEVRNRGIAEERARWEARVAQLQWNEDWRLWAGNYRGCARNTLERARTFLGASPEAPAAESVCKNTLARLEEIRAGVVADAATAEAFAESAFPLAERRRLLLAELKAMFPGTGMPAELYPIAQFVVGKLAELQDEVAALARELGELKAKVKETARAAIDILGGKAR